MTSKKRPMPMSPGYANSAEIKAKNLYYIEPHNGAFFINKSRLSIKQVYELRLLFLFFNRKSIGIFI